MILAVLFMERLRSRPALAAMLGAISMAFSLLLVFLHADALHALETQSLPLAAELPALERREAFLKQQVELSELHAAARLGSEEERFHVYVLPRGNDLDRMLTVIDLLRDALHSEGTLASLSAIEVGDPETAGVDGIAAQTVTMQLAVSEQGLQEVLLFIDLAGKITVGDVLTSGERAQLLRLTEEENPAGIIALEQFLSADLLQYSRDPRPFDDQLKRSFSSGVFQESLQAILRASHLRDTQALLAGPFGRALHQQNLWPLQWMKLDDVQIEQGGAPGWFRVSLVLSLLSREI